MFLLVTILNSLLPCLEYHKKYWTVSTWGKIILFFLSNFWEANYFCIFCSSRANLYPNAGRRSFPWTIFFTSEESITTPWLSLTEFLVFSMSRRSTPLRQSSNRIVRYPASRASRAVYAETKWTNKYMACSEID